MLCTILLELFLPLQPFEKTAKTRWTMITAQILTHMSANPPVI